MRKLLSSQPFGNLLGVLGYFYCHCKVLKAICGDWKMIMGCLSFMPLMIVLSSIDIDNHTGEIC